MKPLKKLSFLLLLVFFTVIIFTACSQSNKLEKVKLAEVTRSIFYAPLYVALEKGFFEEEGLDVELTTTWGGDKTMTTLLSDGADIALVGSETSIYVDAQGATDPVINFAQLTQTDGTFLVSREKIDNFEWEMLKDTTFLGQRKGGMPQMVGEFVLKNKGIDPHSDLELIQNIDFGNIANAFASGTGDFVQLFEPTASVFEKEGKGYIVASFGEESGHVPYTTFMAKQSYMDKNTETIEKFVRALHKAQNWVEKEDSKEIANTVAPYFEDSDIDTLAVVVERYRSQGSFAVDMKLTEDGWQNLQTIMDEAGELPERVDYKKLVNTSIVDNVTK